MKTKQYITKEAWIIKLMQGMVGDYGNENNHSECWYHNGQFFHSYENENTYYLNLNDLNPISNYWITDTKGVPVEPLNVVNIKE